MKIYNKKAGQVMFPAGFFNMKLIAVYEKIRYALSENFGMIPL